MEGCISKPCRERSNGFIPLLGLLLVAGAMGKAADAPSDPGARVTAVRFWSLGDTTRVAIEVSSEFHFKSERLSKPDRLYFDVLGAKPEISQRSAQIIHVDDRVNKQIRVAETQPGVTRVVVDLQQAATMSTSQLSNPARLIIEVKTAGSISSEVSKSEAPAVPVAARVDVVTAPRSAPPVKIVATAEPLSNLESNRSSNVTSNGPAKGVTPKVAATKVSATNVPAANLSATTATEVAPPLAAPHSSEKPKAPESKKSSDAKPVLASAAAASRPANRKADERPVGVPENVVPNPLASSIPSSPSTTAAFDSRKTSPRKRRRLRILPVEWLSALHRSLLVLSRLRRPITFARPLKSRRKRSVTREARNGRRQLSDARARVETGRVVIDPGHGGHDVGTHGPSGYFEKDLVLDVAHRLAALIQERMNAEVILTRTDDTYVGLEERTRIANEHKADLFLSIHAKLFALPVGGGRGDLRSQLHDFQERDGTRFA